jgi:hypothetical protein
MVINIIKGVSVLLLVAFICFIANVPVAIARNTHSMPVFEIAFAWIGTAGAMFYIQSGFWRRLLAALLGSFASLAIPYGINYWASLAATAGHLEYSPVMLFGLQGYFSLLVIGQPAVAFLVAWVIVKRGKLARAATA